ncbi:MAG TPA: heat-inducible transcriptional repressor HrcA [Rhabdochlamydiaceae bacterium]|jgi:heat-inducible transcriptional repressor|nr:heat-inducible transcriptional repressor HrcA [Rhabdochlamydiaceae bacterium]
MKSLISRKPPKDRREKWVLLGLVELYLETGKPVGSNTLRENGFDSLSSATIRNYFSKLEEDGFLKQQHSSGGRIPTSLAYRLYAETHLKAPLIDEKEHKILRQNIQKETRELAAYLQSVAETISEATHCAVFLSAPRFDQDFVLDIKLVGVDASRCLCIIITDFGQVMTELLYSDKKMSSFTLKRLENFFRWRLTGLDKPTLSIEEENLATRFYNEVMMRHLVGSTHFTTEDVYKTGFSKLLAYPDFNDATALADGLGLFENEEALRTLLRECAKAEDLSCWIGGNLHACSALAIPYKINHSTAGSIALLGPNRIPYRKLFGILETASEAISESLTRSLYKFKITFRHPEATEYLLLENKK